MAVPHSIPVPPLGLWRVTCPRAPMHGTRLPSVHKRVWWHVPILRVPMHAMRLSVHCTVYSIHYTAVAAPGFWFGEGGNLGQNFIHEFSLKSCTAMASPQIRFVGGVGHSAKMYSSKTLEKFWKFYKNFALKLKKFSKIFQK